MYSPRTVHRASAIAPSLAKCPQPVEANRRVCKGAMILTRSVVDSVGAPGYQRRQSVELGRTSGLPALLEVKDLHTEFRTGAGLVRAVDGVSYTVDPGETVAIVGEIGSGKPVSALSLLRLIPDPPGLLTTGDVLFALRHLPRLSAEAMRQPPAP